MFLGATLVIRSYIIIILCCGLEVWLSMRTRAVGSKANPRNPQANYGNYGDREGMILSFAVHWSHVFENKSIQGYRNPV